MDGRYLSVCECMKLLRDAQIPPNDRFRLEADFIQIKVGLLRDTDLKRAAKHQYDEQFFLYLLAQIRCLVEKGICSEDVAQLSSDLEPVITSLSCSPSSSLNP